MQGLKILHIRMLIVVDYGLRSAFRFIIIIEIFHTGIAMPTW